MIEDIAKKLYEYERTPGNFDFEWDELSDNAREEWRRDAENVVAALGLSERYDTRAVPENPDRVAFEHVKFKFVPVRRYATEWEEYDLGMEGR